MVAFYFGITGVSDRAKDSEVLLSPAGPYALR